MSIKLSVNIPEVFDTKDDKQLRDVIIAIKQSIDELARKAQSRQMENRTALPSVNDIEENEQVSTVVGGLTYVSTKINGVIKSWLVA